MENTVQKNAQTSLIRALDAFNDDDEDKVDDLTYEFKNILNHPFNVSNKPFSQSIDLKSTLWDESTFETSELWDMQSMILPAKNGSGSLNISTRSSDEITMSTNTKSVTNKTVPLFTPKRVLTKFQHIKTNEIPKFEEFTDDTNGSKFVNFQGLSPPLCTFQTIHSNELHKDDDREYYRMLIPPIYDNQKILLLCCRKKKNMDKFRFSTDEFKMKKRNNPYYIGKMKVIKNEKNKCVAFMVSTKNKKNICSISIIVQPNKSHLVDISLLGNDNLIELNDKIFKGIINNFVQPKLNLIMSTTKRTVMNITDCVNCIESELQEPQSKSSNISNTMMIDFDYPLNLFLSFAIVSAISCRHNYI